MHVLVIGDDFIKGEMVERSLNAALAATIPLQYTHHWTDWPHAPFQFTEEIGEFVGDAAEIACLAQDAHVIVAHMAPLGRRVLQKANNLRVIAVTRGGPINVNVAEATAAGIPVLFVPGRNARTVAEFTVAMMLGQAKRVIPAHHAFKNGEWRTDFYCYDDASFELENKTIGLIGFGAVGRLVAHMVQAFGMHVLVYDPYVSLAEPGMRQVTLEQLLAESDFVSLHARVTPETTHLINERTLAAMKPSAHLINTARGPLVDYDALVDALTNGRIAGAALDTFHEEPLPAHHPLRDLANVVLTPHIAGSSREVAERGIDTVVADLHRLFTGQQPLHCLNPETLKGFRIAL